VGGKTEGKPRRLIFIMNLNLNNIKELVILF